MPGQEDPTLKNIDKVLTQNADVRKAIPPPPEVDESVQRIEEVLKAVGAPVTRVMVNVTTGREDTRPVIPEFSHPYDLIN